MASKVEICNLALKRCGGETIISFTDNTESARLANLYYDHCRKELLREYRWGFAKKRVALAKLNSTPIKDYSYEFQLPSDCIRMLNINDRVEDWEIEGQKLLTNSSTVNALYIADIQTTGMFDIGFTEALSAKLAIRFAWALQQEQGLQQMLIQEYQNIILPISKTINAYENSRKKNPLRVSNWINSRYTGTRNYQ